MTDEVQQFLAEHPGVRAVDTLLCDLSGIFRGTRLDLDGLRRLHAGNYVLESAIYAMDVCGRIAEGSGLGAAEGYADRVCLPVAGSLVPTPWLGTEIGQVQIAMVAADGSPYAVDPRQVLARTEKRLRDRGLQPVVAIELEFYLVDRERLPDSGLQPPRSPLLRRRVLHSQINSMGDLGEYSGVIQEIAATCAAQRVPTTTTIVEYGPGQFEINLRHIADACIACDQAVRFKRAVKGTAMRHGMIATFMAQPYGDATGSGAHVHLSLLDEAGRNVFAAADPLGSATLQRCAAGLLAIMPESTALFAPNANSYRRLRRGGFVPLAATWGANNRSVAVRIPQSDPDNRRLEHRVAGADANPYLVCAALLAGLEHGLAQPLALPPPCVGPASEVPQATALPTSWSEALERFRGSALLREHLGEAFVELYATVRQQELDEFTARVSPLEHDWYLAAL